MAILARCAIVAAMLWAGSAPAFAQTPRPEPTRPQPHTGGFTPFRDRGFAGTTVEAATLEQPDSPLGVTIAKLDRDDRGLTLTLQVRNLTMGPSTRQVFGAWVIAPDGTIRGYQRMEASREIAAGDSRTLELTVRQSTTNVRQGDQTIVAVQESAGARAWRQDQASLQKAVRAAVLP